MMVTLRHSGSVYKLKAIELGPGITYKPITLRITGFAFRLRETLPEANLPAMIERCGDHRTL